MSSPGQITIKETVAQLRKLQKDSYCYYALIVK